MECNNVNSNGENVARINLKLFHFSFLKIVKIEFKMKFQNFFFQGFPSARKSQLFISFTSLIIVDESKRPMFIKFYTMRFDF